MLIKPVIFSFVAFALSSGGLHGADVQAQPAPLGTLVDVGGYHVHLYCAGTGSPTVVVVGGGFSFDWGLVQPQVAGLTRICTYDPSGSAWSDPFPGGKTEELKTSQAPAIPNCSDRVAEIHEVLRRASVSGPFVIVGFSIGGLYGRLYASRYAKDVAGMVIVDHTFIGPDGIATRPPSETHAKSKRPPADSRGVFSMSDVDTPPTLISQTPIEIGIEDDQNFQRLPKRYRDLHVWAMSRHPARPTAETALECAAEVAKETAGQAYPLGTRPLVVISTTNGSPADQKLQAELQVLSRDSKQVIAARSTHMVIVDAPETINAAIGEVVASIRAAALRQ